MNYLKDLGISENTINEIIEKNDEAIIPTFEYNQEKITDIINYLRYVGIKNIDQLLIYEVDLFLKDYEEIKKLIRVEDFETIYNINNDWMYIEELY